MLRCWKKSGFQNAKCNQYADIARNICPQDQLKAFYESRRDDIWYRTIAIFINSNCKILAELDNANYLYGA
jgi:hypothetical protein